MFKLMIRTHLWLAATVALLLASAGMVCAQSSSKHEIVIGYSASLTGKFSTESSDTHRAYQLWASEVDKQGGILVKSLGRKLPVKLVYYDDGSNTNTAISNYERLITKDRVDLLFSPWGSGLNFAVTPLTNKYKYPMVLASAASNAIFARGFKYIFSTTQLASNIYNALANYLAATKQIKTVAIAYQNFIFTRALHTSLLAKLKHARIKVVADEEYPLAGTDFTSLLTKIKAAKPDAFILINIMPSSVYVTRQMVEVGFKPRLYAVNIGPMFTKAFLDTLGSTAEGIVENGFWHQDLPYPGAKQFYDNFRARYKRPPSTDAAYAFIAAQILQQAIEQAGTLDRGKINATLHSGKFSTILGPYQYDKRGVNKYQPSFLCQVQGGKRVIAWPRTLGGVGVKFAPAQ